jgi:hypothetical protein
MSCNVNAVTSRCSRARDAFNWLNHARGKNDSGTYYSKITTFIRTVWWAWKGSAKMEWRIVHQPDADIFRLIVSITTLVSTQNDQT